MAGEVQALYWDADDKEKGVALRPLPGEKALPRDARIGALRENRAVAESAVEGRGLSGTTKCSAKCG